MKADRNLNALRIWKAVLKSWFFNWPILQAVNSPVPFILVPFFLGLFFQVVFFIFALPVLLLVFWPLSVLMCQRGESDWFSWAFGFTLVALIFGTASFLLFGKVVVGSFLIFAVQAFFMGVFVYKDLYVKKFRV